MSYMPEENLLAILEKRNIPQETKDKILEANRKLKPKARVKKTKPEAEQLTAAEQMEADRQRREMKEDEALAPERKRRLTSDYQRRQNAAGRRNPLMRLREIDHIAQDKNVQGIHRFAANPLRRKGA